MLEKQVWKSFKSLWPWHCERIEPRIGAGIPDVLVQNTFGQPGFVELKAANRLHLRPEQAIWHRAWQRGGGRSVVVTRGRNGWHVWQGTFVFDLDLDEGYAFSKGSDMVGYVNIVLWDKP